MSRVLQSTEILGAEVVSFLAQNVSFGMPGASTSAPWGTIERSRGTSEHKTGDLGVQVWISVDLWGISGPHFESFRPPPEQQMFFVMRVHRSRFLMISGSASGCLGLQNQTFGVRSVAKKQLLTYDDVGILLISVSFFLMFFDRFGTSFDDFWCLGNKLET